MWKQALVEHPDQSMVHYLLSGMQNRFRIGFNYSSCMCILARGNMLSTLDHSHVVREYLEHELQEGRVTEITDVSGIAGLQISPFGVIPKKAAGQWRLILDLSSPSGSSVNDGISKDLCSLSYVSIYVQIFE